MIAGPNLSMSLRAQSGSSQVLSRPGEDMGVCATPCRHHPLSEKYPSVEQEKHIPNLQKFIEQLAEGLTTVFPNNQATYHRVHALLITWGPNDDLRTSIEIGELRDLFQKTYHFTTEHFIIPPERSEQKLLKKIVNTWDEHADARDLLIVYYGGHGIIKSGKNIWQAWKEKPSSATTERVITPELDWSEAQRSLMKADGDVLFIMDCCYATFTSKIEPKGGTKELLAATTFKQKAAGSHENSFTRALIRELKQINGAPYTATMIHERLLNHHKEYDIAVPQYVALHRTLNSRSIILVPQNVTLAINPPPEIVEPNPLIRQPKLMTDYRILISVAFVNPYETPDLIQWNEWFRKAAPRNIQDVKLSIEEYIRPEGAWESMSTYYLFSMPVSVWNSLPLNPAYSMLAIIKSDNLLKFQYHSKAGQAKSEVQEGHSKRMQPHEFEEGVAKEALPGPQNVQPDANSNLQDKILQSTENVSGIPGIEDGILTPEASTLMAMSGWPSSPPSPSYQEIYSAQNWGSAQPLINYSNTATTKIAPSPQENTNPQFVVDSRVGEDREFFDRVIAAARTKSGKFPSQESLSLDELKPFGEPDFHRLPFAIRNRSQLTSEITVGAAGELYAYEILSRLETSLPGFGLDNWHSGIRKQVTVHENYRNLRPWQGRETADMTYNDTAGVFTKILIESNYLNKEIWANARPKYFFTVKATTEKCSTRFLLSNIEYQIMQQMKLTKDGPSAEVYIILRVFNLDKDEIDMRVYVDPVGMQESGQLEFITKLYSVIPSAS